MTPEQLMVRQFHDTFKIQSSDTPCVPDLKTRALRTSLINEEFLELEQAFLNGSITEIADALGDLLYVIYGAAIACGLDMQPIFAEIHRSNMTKIGGHKREDGKWVKPDTYSPPNLLPIIKRMRNDED